MVGIHQQRRCCILDAKMGTIVLTEPDWLNIRQRIMADYPASVMLVKSATKRELGFTIRSHESWDVKTGYIRDIRLDFYDDTKETFFRMKYM